MKMTTPQKLDFTNTEIAFTQKSDQELKNTYRMFKLMNNPRLVSVLSVLGLWAVKLKLPLHETMVKQTIFKIFCGGETLLESQALIDQLGQHQVSAALDYGAEGKSDDEDLDAVLQEVLNGIRFAASNDTVPVVITKITALAPNIILKKMQSGAVLTPAEEISRQKLLSRLEQLGSLAEELDVRIFVDAEETWMQDAIDQLVYDMMREYNQKSATIYGTFQLYRVDGMELLQTAYEAAQSHGYTLGAKIVRGAYMENERSHAKAKGIVSPIHATKAATDDCYNDAVRFCLNHYEDLASCTATHNINSNLLMAKLIGAKSIANNHPHLNFCQLLGMSDYVTYNLAASGYNVAKYLVYGPVSEVVPYLIRRAQENTSVTGEMSRELSLIKKEIARRKLH